MNSVPYILDVLILAPGDAWDAPLRGTSLELTSTELRNTRGEVGIIPRPLSALAWFSWSSSVLPLERVRLWPPF